MDDEKWGLAILILVLVVIVGGLVWYTAWKLNASCEDLAWLAAKDVPARCIEYWTSR